MILVADSGSTKVDWVAIKEDGTSVGVKSAGINPLFITQEQIIDTLQTSVTPITDNNVKQVFFYGAGVLETAADGLRSAFKEVFNNAECYIASDLLAAARALCKGKSGIACIVGTGANSCFYDGEQIKDNVNAGGYILGDEASGAYFGRRLLSDFIKRLLPKEIESDFIAKYNLDYLKIVDKVYRQPAPNRYLATFAHFLEQHRDSAYMQNLLKSGFKEFIVRNIYNYNYKEYAANFVGSIAYIFRRELEEVAAECGVKIGGVLRSPIEGLVEYHKGII